MGSHLAEVVDCGGFCNGLYVWSAALEVKRLLCWLFHIICLLQFDWVSPLVGWVMARFIPRTTNFLLENKKYYFHAMGSFVWRVLEHIGKQN